MILSSFYIPFLFSLIPFISCCSTSANETCLHITMTDRYGDGWDNAKLYVEFPDGSQGSDAPNCVNNTIERDICTDTTGIFYMTAAHETTGYVPKNYWEILWTVEICTNGTTTTEYYTGGYNTTMVWSFDDNEWKWSLVYYENLLPNTKECDACGDAEQCSNEHEGGGRSNRRRRRGDNDRRRRSPDREGRRPGGKRNGNDGNGIGNNSTRRLDGNESVIFPSPYTTSYGEPYVDTRVTMWDFEGDGWWLENYLGSSWFIADSTRTQLFYTGTLCNGTSGFCNICLADGEYTIRFTGETSTFTSWDFCGVTGTYGEELVFEVHDGKCNPLSLLSLEQACNGAVNATYTFASELEICFETTLNTTDSALISTIIGTLKESLEVDTVTIKSIALQTEEEAAEEEEEEEEEEESESGADGRERKQKKERAAKKSSRKGGRGGKGDEDASYTYVIRFWVTVRYETEDLLAYDLLEEFEDVLEDKIEDGSFLATLINNSAANSYDLKTTCGIESDDFTLVSLNIDGSLQLVASKLQFSPSSTGNHQVVVSQYDYSAIALFFGAVAVGFIAFVGIVSRGVNGYAELPDESQHLDMSSTSSHHGLLHQGIEMDHTISNPLGRNAVHEAELSRVSASL